MDLREYIIHTYELINLDNIDQLGQYQQDKGQLLSHLIEGFPHGINHRELEFPRPYFYEKIHAELYEKLNEKMMSSLLIFVIMMV
jgi:hypothetical protein